MNLAILLKKILSAWWSLIMMSGLSPRAPTSSQVLTAAQMGQWDLIEKGIEALQGGNMRMKYLSKPVVTAPAGLALGGGCEMAMHGARCLPNGETYMGLVEVGVGVIPAGGGCKELLVRLTEGIPDGIVETGLNLQYYMAKPSKISRRRKFPPARRKPWNWVLFVNRKPST